MEDILESKISYQHRGLSSASSDTMQMSVNDTNGSHYRLSKDGPILTTPFVVRVEVLETPTNSTIAPKIISNRGIEYLENKDGQVPQTFLFKLKNLIERIYFYICLKLGILDFESYVRIFESSQLN